MAVSRPYLHGLSRQRLWRPLYLTVRFQRTPGKLEEVSTSYELLSEGTSKNYSTHLKEVSEIFNFLENGNQDAMGRKGRGRSVYAAAMLSMTYFTTFSRSDPLTVVNNLSDFIFRTD